MKKQNRIALFNIISTVVLNGISFFTGPLFFRLLGDSGYGVLKIYNIWVSVAAIAFTLQTQGTLVNARVEYPEQEQNRYQSAVMGLSLFFFCLCSGLVLLFMGPVSRLLRLEPVIVCLVLLNAFGTFCVDFLNTKFVYEFKAGRNMVISLGITLTALVMSLILVLQFPQDLRYFGRILGNSSTYGLIGILACLLILTKGKTLVHRGYWKFCLPLAIPVVFHNLSDLILGQSDQVMLQQMVGEAAVGRYGMAWNFGGVIFIIFGALNRVWCPYFFDEMKENQRESMMCKTYHFLELFTVLAVGFLLLSPEVFTVYSGRAMNDSLMVLPMFVTSYYLNFLCTFPVNYEYYHKKTNAVALVTISASLLNIPLNFILIRAIGMPGAALATVLSHGVQLLCHYGYTRYILGKGDYPFGISIWWKYAAAYILVLTLVYATPNGGLLRWGIGAAVGLWELLRIRKRKVLI